MKSIILLLVASLLILCLPHTMPDALPAANAQSSELAASLEVLEAGVEVRRTGTADWVAVRVESLIGTGDSIRTNATGEARIIFFADGAEITLTPSTEIVIDQFSGDSEQFTISLRMLSGITFQQILRALDSNSTYSVQTPAVNMTVRGTEFAVRVEDTGRASVLTEEGAVGVSSDSETAEVPPGFGLRAPVDGELSDVVPATTFEELDAALDGCLATFFTEADVRLNVRLGPGTEFTRVGSISATEINRLLGVTEDSGWYRIPFRGSFAWVSAAGLDVTVDTSCPGLREFPNDYEEDVSEYSATGDGDAVVVTASANLRIGPGTVFEQIGIVADGSELDIVGQSADGEWLQIITRDGRAGWIATYLVRLNISLDTVPIIEEGTSVSDSGSGGGGS